MSKQNILEEAHKNPKQFIFRQLLYRSLKKIQQRRREERRRKKDLNNDPSN